MTMPVPPPDEHSAAAVVEVDAARAAGDDVLGEVRPTSAPIDVKAERRQARRERRRLLMRRPSFVIGAVILTFWVICAIAGDRITPFDPILEFDSPNIRPNAKHWFGTDQIGRDVLSRVMAGSRDILAVAPIAAVLSLIAGVALGLVMGYYRGWVDEALSRIVEALLSIPVILVGLLIVTSLGNSRIILTGTIAVLFAPVVTRTVRAAVLSESRLDYVTSARLRGESGAFVMFREILPNITGALVVEFTVRVGYAVFTLATLSFLGLGIPPPSPNWGVSINDTFALIPAGQWWATLFPALAIASLVIATNLIADSIDAVANDS
ncbi:ABC transporter permease [soil metagenome]